MDAICACCRGRPGARRQASIWYQVPGVAREMMTVMVSVARMGAHQPPLGLISVALRPAMVGLGFRMRHAGKPLALHPTRHPPRGRVREGGLAGWADPPGRA